MANYKKMTDEEFDGLLREIVAEEAVNGANLISVPGAYEVFAEHFNNDVLDRWAERNPDKAYQTSVTCLICDKPVYFPESTDEVTCPHCHAVWDIIVTDEGYEFKDTGLQSRGD